MIESQTEFPAQERGPAAIWAKSRRVSAAFADRLREQAQALPGTRGAQYLRDLWSLVGDKAEQFQIRAHLSRTAQWITAGARDGSLLNRYALHLVIILLAIGVVVVSQVTIPEVDLVLPEAALADAEIEQPTDTASIAPVPTNNRGVNRLISSEAVLFPAPVLHTTVSERDRMAFITYTVQPNDNIWAIAQGFGLKAETVLWANPKVEKAPDLLSVGQRLVIPPVDGIYYTVAKGDTVEKLAKTYKTTVEKIVGFETNQLEEPYTLAVGQQIMLPDGRKQVVRSNYYPMTRVGSAPKNAPKGTGRFAWPTQGLLTQRFWSGHLGIDIANRTGVPVRAADDGYVIMAGRDTWGYGNQVLIDHGNGYLTRYAHLDQIKVKAGESVQRNQQIGTMGNTGRSTGPHLHFEIIYGQQRRNPLGFLP
jgi:murein DD-endopeptidase MepM/ murein hydrolase activator NlpD